MAFILKSFEFRRGREKTWRELDRLVNMVEAKGIHALTAAELARLPLLYRATLSSLSVARSISLDRNVVEYLESLAARAYFCVYGTKRRLSSAIAEFFARRFPAAVRGLGWHVLVSALFMGLGTLTAFLVTVDNPDAFYDFVSEDYAQGRGPGSSTESLREVLYHRGAAEDRLATFASFLFTNNARIGMMAFALGFLAGVPVYLLLFMNGMILGAFGGLYQGRGLGLDFWGWVLPHGITELGAVVLCGAAGLALAQNLVFPGRHGRLRNLAKKGRRAGMVVVGAVAMFFIAGLIEGIFRQTVHAIFLRYLVALTSLAFWVWYFLYVGRRKVP